MIQAIDTIDSRRTCRHFNRMVQAAKPRFIPVKVDAANHIARGLLEARGEARSSELTYEETRCLVCVTAVLKTTATLSPAQRNTLDQVQSSAALARLDPDVEHSQLFVRGCSVCTVPDDLGTVVRAIIKDIRRVLSDDRLNAILDH